MNEVKCTIPADMLRETSSALMKLARHQRKKAFKFSDEGLDASATETLKESAATQTLADFWFERYCQGLAEAQHEEV